MSEGETANSADASTLRTVIALKTFPSLAGHVVVEVLEVGGTVVVVLVVDVLEVATPDAVLLEGTPAMMGDGFQQMVPVTPNVAIGGTNVVRVDQVGSMFLGAWDSERLARGLLGRKSSPLAPLCSKT